MTYIVVRYVFALMQMFPIEWNLRTARFFARIWVLITPRHRDRAIENLSHALGDQYPPERITELADRCLEAVTMFAIEAICLPRLVREDNWNQYIELDNFDEALEVLLKGEGAILVTGHYGSFELTGHLLACLGFDIVAIMRPLDNAYLNNFIVNARGTHGLRLIDKKGATEHARAELEGGSLLAFIGDQDAGRKGKFVGFFGRPASAYKSIGLLAMLTDRPIIVGYARRLGTRPRYLVGAKRVIYPHEWKAQDKPLDWITQTYTSAMESFIREDPSQYLWMHRRWKSQPGQKRKLRKRPAPASV